MSPKKLKRKVRALEERIRLLEELWSEKFPNPYVIERQDMFMDTTTFEKNL